jgi:hypothetical protein
MFTRPLLSPRKEVIVPSDFPFFLAVCLLSHCFLFLRDHQGDFGRYIHNLRVTMTVEMVQHVPPPFKKKAHAKFRVPIHKPSQIKIDAVINYKRSKGLLGKTPTVTKKVDEPGVSENNSSSSSGSSSSSSCSNSGSSSSSSSGGVGVSSGPASAAAPASSTNVASLVEVCNGLQREQDNLRRSNRLIRDEIASLNDVQHSLIWLLKKVRQHETCRAAMGPGDAL